MTWKSCSLVSSKATMLSVATWKEQGNPSLGPKVISNSLQVFFSHTSSAMTIGIVDVVKVCGCQETSCDYIAYSFYVTYIVASGVSNPYDKVNVSQIKLTFCLKLNSKFHICAYSTTVHLNFCWLSLQPHQRQSDSTPINMIFHIHSMV